MNQNIIKIKKISKAMMMVVRGLIIVLVVAMLYTTATSFVINNNNGLLKEIIAVGISSINALLIIAVLVVASRLLKSIGKDYTPFSSKNVKMLKVAAGLLMIFEPVHIIAQKIINTIRPVILENGQRIAAFSFFGGVFFVLGLVVFCIALTFEYGIELQKQSDETL
ncbi:DUF2975 domain-containing protein [Clostridium cellulovorans]|uniref:DUF2975 domain-containing protein n=1 Tax=Clostridium cellulovorans (strain ATCC 35296 / DSM 3052 / OCM 3 / 743B) TaxID=573061 RepID=D9STD6_CLOC7|nr:DUF2975 domain-containing protein [Clostridium cellulovorans]ADL50752.1 hypothetical protein Clocel_0987 [Clostridium cellulovorans 743B]